VRPASALADERESSLLVFTVFSAIFLSRI
jgi:hypothetical protein